MMNRYSSGEQVSDRLVDVVASPAIPLGYSRDLDPLMARIGEARFVLLGEASHGPSEYYTWRVRLTITNNVLTIKGDLKLEVAGYFASKELLAVLWDMLYD